MNLPRPVQWLLWPLSLIYGAAVRLRARCFASGLCKAKRLNGVVISVGNLTVGGTGKTPLVMWLAERLRAQNRRVGILSRGYRGTGAMSDEVAMMADRLGDVVAFGVGPDRYEHGMGLAAKGIETFILDDGFQHLQLARDADVVTLDATDAFGGGFLLPAGRLREPRAALARADVVVITRAHKAPALESVVRRHTQAPIFYAAAKLEGMFTFVDRQPAGLSGKPLFAFCGIGNPRAFFDDLSRWGFDVTGTATFRDHHVYSSEDARVLCERARRAGAAALVCTEKDSHNFSGVTQWDVPVYFARISLEVLEGNALLDAVHSIAQRKRGRAS